MDVNLTRFHLVYGQADWFPGSSSSVEPLFDWNDCDATLGLHQELFVFSKRGQLPLDVADRRGAGRDIYGNWYTIASSQDEIRFLAVNDTAAEHFWSAADEVQAAQSQGEFFAVSPPPAPDIRFAGLAVTPEHYLVAGTLQPAGLAIFDLHAGGPPARMLWPSGIPFEPFDMSVAPDGGVFVLDRVNKLCWRLDRNLRIQSFQSAAAPLTKAEPFHPVGGGVGQLCIVSQVDTGFAICLSGISDPVAAEALSDGSVLILENPSGGFYSILHRFQNGVETGASVSLASALSLFVSDAPSSGNPFPQAVRGYDLAAIGTTVYIAGIEGDQTFAFDLSVGADDFSLTAQPRYFPMRQFQGNGLVAAAGVAYYDFQDRWFPITSQPQPRYRTTATLQLPQQTIAFDGKLPGCVWHRLFLEACIPPGASVAIDSRAADLPQLLPDAPWQHEPAPYLRDDGPELPFYQSQLQGSPDRTGTWETLFQNSRGRYLQLRLTLTGTGRNTPRLHALRIYYPRFSYLRQYLPAVYREDAVSSSFLDRFLANVEGIYTVLEGKIESAQALFDPRIVPAEYLDWLGSWMSIGLDSGWSEGTRRLVLAHAAQMFQQRGTRMGMIRALRLALEACPGESLFEDSDCGSACGASSAPFFTVRLIEQFLTRSAPGVDYGQPVDGQNPDFLATAGTTSSGSTNAAWTPALGVAPLNTSWRCYLQNEYGTIGSLNAAWGTAYVTFDDTGLTLPPVQPAQPTQAADWRRYLRDSLGFTYAPVTSADLASWQAYLAARYYTIGDLNTAYKLSGTDVYPGFESVALPQTMPNGGQPLQDWIAFAAAVLPGQRNAHRFTILVPVNLTDDAATQQTKLGIAGRVASVEKPAHVSFDVKPYWAMFQTGTARLGQDTLLGPGSRFAALVLGTGTLASGTLASANPIVQRDRRSLPGLSALQQCCNVQSNARPQERRV